MATALSPTLKVGQVSIGDQLPPLEIPLTPTLIVSTALATRDYQDVHHDRDLAQKKGSPDIFMNILTTTGFVGRYVGDWAGPEHVLRKTAIRLGAPNYPYDTMTMTGTVTAKDDETGVITIDIVGANQLGNHVTGSVELELPH